MNNYFKTQIGLMSGTYTSNCKIDCMQHFKKASNEYKPSQNPSPKMNKSLLRLHEVTHYDFADFVIIFVTWLLNLSSVSIYISYLGLFSDFKGSNRIW